MTITIPLRRTGLAVLTAAALFGAAQVALHPAPADAQTAAPVAGDVPGTLSATGLGQIPGDTAQADGALMMAIEERSTAADLQTTVQAVQARVAKLRAALVAAGVPASAIHTQGFNIGPNYGYPIPAIGAAEPAAPDASGTGGGGATPVRPMPPPSPSGYTVNAQMMVDTTSPEQMASAMRVAIDNGATNVNSFVKGGPGNPTPPEASQLAPAIRRATEQARSMAAASAEAAGVTLGTLQSVTVLPPTPSWGGGPGPVPTVTWQVQVRVTYAIN